jgi:tetratricopeptide (TPR) repeat protein
MLSAIGCLFRRVGGEQLAQLLGPRAGGEVEQQGAGGVRRVGDVPGAAGQPGHRAAAAQRAAAAVQHRRPDVGQGLGLVGEPGPVPVQAAERVLHHVLGGGPVAQHDVRQPDQAQGVRVVQRGDQMTLSLELVDTRTENVVWSEQYNRKQSDLLSLQTDIARDVSAKLRTKLSGADEKKLAKNYTANPEAYQLYLKGRFYWNKRTADGLTQAANFYKQAIEKDPAYALAYSGLAETYVLFSQYSVAAPKESMPLAKAAALKALELDDSIAEAHAALGTYFSGYGWDPSASVRELRRAIELKPNYATAHHWLAILYAASQRADEAISTAHRAEELDPLSLIISADTGFDLILLRRYDEAITQLQKTLKLDPQFYYAHYMLGWAYLQKGMYSHAIAECRESLKLNPELWGKALLTAALARSGGRAEATKLRDELKSETAGRYVASYFVAIADTALGEKDKAFAALEKDFVERSTYFSFVPIDPLFDDLHTDPRWAGADSAVFLQEARRRMADYVVAGMKLTPCRPSMLRHAS